MDTYRVVGVDYRDLMRYNNFGLHQAEACTKRGLAPSGGLHQAEA